MSVRLRVVPHFSSGIVERAKRERAWKSPHSRKGYTWRGERKTKDPHFSLSPPRVAFSRVGWFSRPLAFRSLYYPWRKRGDYSWSICTESTVYCLLRHPKGERVVQWWEHLPPTNVARVRILVSTPYVGWVCCWFSPLLREVFLCVLRKPIWRPVTKSSWSWPSYRKIGDCEQSNIRVKQGTLVKLTVQSAKRMLHLACFPPPAQAFPFAHLLTQGGGGRMDMGCTPLFGLNRYVPLNRVMVFCSY